jgi:hypothetical protein
VSIQRHLIIISACAFMALGLASGAALAQEAGDDGTAPGGEDGPGEEDWDDGWDDDEDEPGEGSVVIHSGPDIMDRDEPIRDESGKPIEDVQKGFIKGELAAVGRIDLLSRYHRVGLQLGTTSFDRIFYARFDPIVELNYPHHDLHLGFGAPLNFLAADFNVPVDKAFTSAGEFRREDWDSVGDFLQVIRYATYGGKEREVFVNLSQVDSVTIGHGPVMRRYVANQDVNRHRVGAEVDAYNDHAGFEAHLNDVAEPSIFGLLAFIKPGRFMTGNRPLKRLSIGAHYTADFSAPLETACSQTKTFHYDPARNIDNFVFLTDEERSLFQSGVLSEDQVDCIEAGRRGYYEVLGDQTLPRVESEELVHFVGVSVEFKPVRTAKADLKPYLDFTQMIGHGSGIILGALGRFNVGVKRHSAFRLRVEGRSHDANYIPSYFDILYEVDRYASLQALNAGKPAQSKLSYVKSLEGEDRRLGYYLEGTYSLRNWFALTSAWEDGTGEAAKTLLLHLELPASKWFTLFFTYVKRNFEEPDSNPFDFKRDGKTIGNLEISDELFFWAFRVKILPILAFNFRGQKAFEVRDEQFQQVFHFIANLELGYEF